MATGGDGEAQGVPHASDLDLVSRALAGETLAIELVCRRLDCVPAILRDRHARYGSPLRADELEEVQQETLVALWAKLGAYEGRASLETWAFRFTVLELLKCFARRDRRRNVLADSEGELERAPDREESEPLLEPERVHSGLERLGPPANDIIRMRHFEERSFEEIASAYGEPVNTIKARYYRGLERLRELLQPHLRGESR
ncbi:MAG: sigma-70 family RNA polymerase sigma factor [Planctomycetes bacterium]|nr:sigma-70 family RNA polymerase sigma factor [Planctomycetota bacterium]